MSQFHGVGGLELAIFDPFFAHLGQTGAAPWLQCVRGLTHARLLAPGHGDWVAWMRVLERLPCLPSCRAVYDRPCVGVEGDGALSESQLNALRSLLLDLHPWRKGPFCLHGVRIDAEWRSDWKWARAAAALGTLDDAIVLDLGCGNGYYAFRALGAGARLVVGIDPGLRFVAQFLAVNHFMGCDRLAVLPLADVDLQDQQAGVDLVFSMGVLYHRRDPMQHLRILRRLLLPGGRLLLETLVLADGTQEVLQPGGRYAQMRNVYAIPSLSCLVGWVRTCGFSRVDVVDVTATTTSEQRSTAWMRFQSLKDFLDPADDSRTCEGHPAPVRAILLAS